ncbi:FAD/NAD(P)-binding domain-containing protein [Glaciihabitans sp. dw_435]|uniref:FAD/NAD(P)-binding protein n=1 Tax=Glaciihabitans sp. dw_435 TaxID=2720081 RepID=UPI001BD668A3|nr:FAD/NAD(P)-binding protein [Glaciihabitans sp. dw_435]
MTRDTPVRIAVVGVGPRGAGFLERLAANVAELGADVPVLVHLIDPHPPGAGRIWRYEQSALLRLNSMAEDVTMFTDESSTIDGPVSTGPSLIEWADRVRSGEITGIDLSDDTLRDELTALTGSSFPTRRLQSLYLDWFYRRAVDALPDSVAVLEHAAAVERVVPGDAGEQRVVLSGGETLTVDIVLYALGHTGVEPRPEHRELAEFAAGNGLYYLPPSFTADADTAAIRPGENLIVRGMGLAAVDLVVLLTEGRGGRFVPGDDGVLRYEASGREPHIHLGSRRGVPYRSKISSRLAAPRATARFFTAEIVAELERTTDRLEFREHVWPLIAKEMLWGYYWELFTGHPDRVSGDWQSFADRFEPLRWDAPELRRLVEQTVPDPIDRLDLTAFDRPLAGLTFESPALLQDHLRDHIALDLRLRSDPAHSATLALFYSLLFSLFDLGGVVDSPKWSARSRVEELGAEWLGYFSYVASGPPASRLDELLALSRAGIVEFLGADAWVRADVPGGSFVAGSPSVPGQVTARALVDARLPQLSIRDSDNPALRSLVESGVGSEEYLDDGDFAGSTGRLRVRTSDARILGPDDAAHPRLFAIGPFTSAPFVGAFARPRTNAVSFRENDRVARAILAEAREVWAARSGQLSATSLSLSRALGHMSSNIPA